VKRSKKYVDHLDGVFLNAGVATFVPIEAATPKNHDDMFNVNVRGLYFQLQSLLPLLGNPSSVVFTSSIAGSTAFAGASIYSATKAAVISLGRTLAVELAQRGVRVNVLSPGPIDTPIIKKAGLPPDQLKGFEETIVARSLLKRFGTSDEVARAARFLLSEDSSNITGTELIIDGGVRLN
jgi:NAD(P)-dependent dehydrogenase (short-subunit alcohol dehydrogenase family)